MNAKKYIVRFIYLTVILFFVDFITGYGLQSFYFKQKQGKLYNVTFALEQQTAEVLILGSSRAMHHYNPDVISDSLGLTCFNAGYDGQSILYHKALFDVITERYTPKMIILDVNTYELSKNESAYDLLSVLNPYVKRHPVLWRTLLLQSSFERVKHCSRIYPYNSLFARIVMGNMNLITKDVTANGFTAQPGIFNDTIKTVSYQDEELDVHKVNAFNQLLLECKQRNIAVYIVKSPAFEKEENRSTTINYIAEICEQEGIPFISYENSHDFSNIRLFHDPGHLNDVGADKFSRDLARILSLCVIKKSS